MQVQAREWVSEWITFKRQNSISRGSMVTLLWGCPYPLYLVTFLLWCSSHEITVFCTWALYLLHLSEFYQTKLPCDWHIRDHITNTTMGRHSLNGTVPESRAHGKKGVGVNRSPCGLKCELGKMWILCPLKSPFCPLWFQPGSSTLLTWPSVPSSNLCEAGSTGEASGWRMHRTI